MEKFKKALYQEFVAGHTGFDYVFLLTGIVLQIVVFILFPKEPINVVSGIAGVLCVVLGAQGKISNFVFGLIQVSTYIYLSISAK